MIPAPITPTLVNSMALPSLRGADGIDVVDVGSDIELVLQADDRESVVLEQRRRHRDATVDVVNLEDDLPDLGPVGLVDPLDDLQLAALNIDLEEIDAVDPVLA